MPSPGRGRVPARSLLSLCLSSLLCCGCGAAAWSAGPDRCPRSSPFTAADDVLAGTPCTYAAVWHGAEYLFDFRPACLASGDYATALNGDGREHQYFSNVCANVSSAHGCFPASPDPGAPWLGRVTMFSSRSPEPPCNGSSPECVDPSTGRAVCCTRPCAVLGLGAPAWALADASDPWRGGVVGRYAAQRTPSGGAWQSCGSDESTVYEWFRLVVEMECDFGAATTALRSVQQVSGEARVPGSPSAQRVCDIVMTYSSPTGCALARLSWGWLFLCVLMVVLLLYVGFGSMLKFLCTGRFDFLHRACWDRRFLEVRVGNRLLRKWACEGDARNCPSPACADCSPAFCCLFWLGAWTCLPPPFPTSEAPLPAPTRASPTSLLAQPSKQLSSEGLGAASPAAAILRRPRRPQ
jgi:hypothetical protein